MCLVRPDGTGLHRLDLGFPTSAASTTSRTAWTGPRTGRSSRSSSLEDDLPEAGVDTGLRIDIATIVAGRGSSAQQRLEFDPTADNELNPMFLPGTDKLLFNTREGIVDFVSVGVPGVPGRTIIKPGNDHGGGHRLRDLPGWHESLRPRLGKAEDVRVRPADA